MVGVEKRFIIEVLDGDVGLDPVLLGNGEKILDHTPGSGLAGFRKFENTEPMAATGFSEEQQVVVVGGHEHVLDEILITCL